MRIARSRFGSTAAAATFGVLIATMTGASAPPGVPITFDQFHTTTAVFRYLKDVAAENAANTELRQIGTSTMGRPVYVLVVSNMKTGTTIDTLVPLRNPRAEGVKNVTPMKPYMGKPGHWIGGSTHGNEYTGTEVALAMVDRGFVMLEANTALRRSTNSSRVRSQDLVSVPSSESEEENLGFIFWPLIELPSLFFTPLESVELWYVSRENQTVVLPFSLFLVKTSKCFAGTTRKGEHELRNMTLRTVVAC